MTNEQFAAYLEQLTAHLGLLLQTAQNALNEHGITHALERNYTDIFNVIKQPLTAGVDYEDVETPNIEALQPLFWFLDNLQQDILMLDPKENT